MRRPRVKVDGEGFYHVVSRIAGRRFLIDEAEKGILLGTIRAAAAFSGVEVYSFAIMSNHFHLLVRVPKKAEVSDKELEARTLALYGPGKFNKVLAKWARWTRLHQEGRVENEKARLRARMFDLSQFCKTFKETYTQDYNKRHGNTGSIWEGRFKSVLLEGSFRALMTVSGYIHLNPVRATVVERPEDSKWTGYGAGCRGSSAAQNGLCALVSRAYGARAKKTAWEEAKAACAAAMDGRVPNPADSPDVRPGRAAVPESDVVETDGKGRPLRAGSMRALLMKRSAGFVQGGALGPDPFLRRAAKLLPDRTRKRPEALFDRCAFLGLKSAAGVREVS